MITTDATLATETPRRPVGWPPPVHYALHSTWLTMKNFAFVVFAVGLPLVLYVVFSQTFTAGAGPDAGLVSAMIMVSMAAYGALGAAMSGGAQLATERRSGWFRQLSITTLAPREFLLAKAAVIMVLVLPSLVLVFAAGFLLGGVRLPVGVWLASLGLMWAALIPLAILGIVIGLWVKAEAVGGVTTLVLLVLAMLGGLWLPMEMMPPAAQALAHALPSYWLAELGRWPMLPDTSFPWTGVLVLLAWVVGLTVLGALGFRRATASSKR
ncbi:ABC transporter permease [Microlunatus aurantiacus]|uniref:Transport permease protein n=1 Tax=Microlunatus aurantiacus TaxID=446786 RepID=A0ABP7CKK7_9ACTN